MVPIAICLPLIIKGIVTNEKEALGSTSTMVANSTFYMLYMKIKNKQLSTDWTTSCIKLRR